MRSTKNWSFCINAVLLCLIIMFASQATARAAASKEDDSASQTKEEESMRIGADAYVFGYPLVTMEMTRRVMTNVDSAAGKFAPMGQFAHLRNYPTANDKEITAPNADTLYSLAWLDLSKEPYVLSIPDANGRFYLMPMLDGWTTVFADPGTRATGTNAQKYIITGPGWKRKTPADMSQYKSPTNIVWILGRTYSTGTEEDYAKVHSFQDQLSLVPLSSYGKEYTPPAGKADPAQDMQTPVRDQVNRMDGITFFKVLAELMKDNPPLSADSSFVGKMAKIGLVPGKDFDPGQLNPAVAKALESAPKLGQEKIMAEIKRIGKSKNGWTTLDKTGIYGTDYIKRAVVAAVGLGANRPEDAVYPTSDSDVDDKPYDGSKKYVMHFDKDQIPPVEAFWSMTMYDGSYFFVPNALNRSTIGSRSPLKYNADGSLDLYFQNSWPGRDKQANWLPAPDGKFILMLRMYWPKAGILDHKYTIPPVRQIN
jgi:hypothetical protein